MRKILALVFLLSSIAFGQQIINDLTVKDLKVVSTSKGSKPCPLMTSAQIAALASPLNGQCAYNTTTNKLNVYNGSLWKAAGGGVDSWLTSTSYAVDDLVIQSDKIYQCLTAHTSGVFATDLAALKWKEISVGVTSHTALSDIGTNSHAQIDTDLTRLANTSGTNTGDNATNSQYSGLSTSKQDTLVSATNIKTINSNSILGSGDLAIVIPNLSGDITSLSGVTTYNNSVPLTKGGTGQTSVVSGDLIYGNGVNTTAKLAIGTETKSLKVVGGQVAWAEEDRSNLLINPNFEGTLGAEWTSGATGTLVKTTTSGEFSEGLAGLKVTPATNVFDFSQTVNVTGIAQKVVGIDYKVPATCTTFVIRVYADTVLQTTVPTTSLIKDGAWHTIEVPTTASTSVKINPYANGSCTGDAFFDRTYVKSGLGTQALQLDNVYSAQVSSANVISNPNITGWLSTAAWSPAGTLTLTPSTGRFSATPNCWGISWDDGQRLRIVSASSNSIVMTNRANDGTGNSTASVVTIFCQKSGNDYLASSAAVYSQASANYSYTNGGVITITATTTNPVKGTVGTDRVIYQRNGQNLDAYYQYDQTALGSATTGTGDYLFLLPNGLSFDSNNVIFFTGLIASGASSKSTVGTVNFTNGTEIGYTGSLIAYDATHFRMAIGYNAQPPRFQSGVWFALNNATTLGWSFHLNAPISGWSNSASIVGSFEKIEKCANDLECTDVFSAQVSSTGVVTSENKDWINGNCVMSGTNNGRATCTLNTNIKDGINPLTTGMNCSIGPLSWSANIISTSSSNFVAEGFVTTSGVVNPEPFHIMCQKTGADSKPKTAKIASSIGVPTVPGITTEAVDTFSVSYGTTNATTACSASPCSYLDQIGTAVTSITRSGTGAYSLNTVKTYAKLKCSYPFGISSASGIVFSRSNLSSCSNCSSITWNNFDSAFTAIDSSGTIMCQGVY